MPPLVSGCERIGHFGSTRSGVRIEFSEQVVETGPGCEVVELTATVAAGTVDRLFVRLEFLGAL